MQPESILSYSKLSKRQFAERSKVLDSTSVTVKMLCFSVDRIVVELRVEDDNAILLYKWLTGLVPQGVAADDLKLPADSISFILVHGNVSSDPKKFPRNL